MALDIINVTFNTSVRRNIHTRIRDYPTRDDLFADPSAPPSSAFSRIDRMMGAIHRNGARQDSELAPITTGKYIIDRNATRTQAIRWFLASHLNLCQHNLRMTLSRTQLGVPERPLEQGGTPSRRSLLGVPRRVQVWKPRHGQPFSDQKSQLQCISCHSWMNENSERV